MRILSAFLKDKRSVYLIYFVTVLLMMGTFFLHDLPWAAFQDSLLFSGAVVIVYCFVSFYRWLPKYQRLMAIKNQGLLAAELFLPPADTTNEGLLQEILQKEVLRNNELLIRDQQKRQELLDDFGLWLHQIKTPVAAMDLLLQGGESDVFSMKRELFKVNEYLQLMLNYMRNSLDNQDFVFQKVSVAELVRETVKKYAAFFSQKDLGLELQDLTGIVVTDPKWLQFILEQVLFNAIKYTEQGQITVSFTNNCLSIADTGIGIREEDLPRVFEKGYTGYNGRTQQRASGLGLYLSKQVAEKIGIKLTLQSKIGVGTTIQMGFPSLDEPKLNEV